MNLLSALLKEAVDVVNTSGGQQQGQQAQAQLAQQQAQVAQQLLQRQQSMPTSTSGRKPAPASMHNQVCCHFATRFSVLQMSCPFGYV